MLLNDISRCTCIKRATTFFNAAPFFLVSETISAEKRGKTEKTTIYVRFHHHRIHSRGLYIYIYMNGMVAKFKIVCDFLRLY